MTTPPVPGAIDALPAAPGAAAEQKGAPVTAGALPARSMNLLPRVASSAVLVVLVAGMIYLGGIPLDVLVGAAAALGAWELASLLARCPVPAPRWLVIVLGVWLAERAILPGAGGDLGVILPAALVAGMIAGVLLRSPWEGRPQDWGRPLSRGRTGQPARPLPLVGRRRGRGARPGRDRGRGGGRHRHPGVLTGHALGRHPFFPSISPRKSAEGAVGEPWGRCWSPARRPLVVSLNPFLAVGMGLLIAVAAEGGDLAESALKRQAGSRTRGG